MTAGLLPLPERSILEVSGPLRLKFLHGVLSNDLQSRRPGQGCRAALMDVKGHLVALLRALVDEDAVLLEVPTDKLQRVESLLAHYRVAAPVRFQARPEAVLAVVGPGSRGVLERAGAPALDLAPEDHRRATVAGTDVRVVKATDLPGDSHVLHVPREAEGVTLAALRQAGGEDLDRAAFDAMRVEAGRPWYGVDVTEENLLHETGLLAEHHSSTKGCYVGQEVVARLEARGGHVNKSLRGLRLTAPATRGAAVTWEGREVGRVTTAAVSPRLGPVALAYVHRSRFEPGSTVEVDGRPATVERLPFPVGE